VAPDALVRFDLRMLGFVQIRSPHLGVLCASAVKARPSPALRTLAVTGRFVDALFPGILYWIDGQHVAAQTVASSC